ncbi:MBL fold metallo-hydrolase [Candidatus Acetothermia bacterium]|nr:MBL fold metallo-hydrolase [Candidatus Acetothermia bacterium]MBI3659320.1 MBL fold metallo-hydrolase [Candidatus Acetothermia bacterium]
MRIILFSKALYANWIYYSPDRLLFDAGEGVSSVLGNKAFAIERVFLSHGHTDHITGLIGFINIRNSGMGDTEKPLYIYYPKGNWRISELMNYIHRTNRNLHYSLEWIPLDAGQRVSLFEGQNERYLETFPTVHSGGETSLGFNVVEVRTRLKPDYRDLPQSEIVNLVRQGKKEEMSERYPKKLFSYSGDSIPLDPTVVEGTDILCHDSTFLVEEERDAYKHATFSEALEVALRAGVQEVFIAMHISTRYKRDLERVQEQLHKEHPKLPFKVILVPPGRVFTYE